jgi:hypothetical protein
MFEDWKDIRGTSESLPFTVIVRYFKLRGKELGSARNGSWRKESKNTARMGHV